MYLRKWAGGILPPLGFVFVTTGMGSATWDLEHLQGNESQWIQLSSIKSSLERLQQKMSVSNPAGGCHKRQNPNLSQIYKFCSSYLLTLGVSDSQETHTSSAPSRAPPQGAQRTPSWNNRIEGALRSPASGRRSSLWLHWSSGSALPGGRAPRTVCCRCRTLEGEEGRPSTWSRCRTPPRGDGKAGWTVPANKLRCLFLRRCDNFL